MTNEQFAYRAWNVLCRIATRRELITYSELAAEIGAVPVGVGRILSLIQTYCLDEKLPPLTILVVNKHTERPGGGFIAWDARGFQRRC